VARFCRWRADSTNPFRARRQPPDQHPSVGKTADAHAPDEAVVRWIADVTVKYDPVIEERTKLTTGRHSHEFALRGLGFLKQGGQVLKILGLASDRLGGAARRFGRSSTCGSLCFSHGEEVPFSLWLGPSSDCCLARPALFCYQISPMTSISDNRKGPGRPPTGVGVFIGVRWRPSDLARLDTWIAAQPVPRPTRPEAIRRLVEQALAKR
jgi:hypothetical protein